MKKDELKIIVHISIGLTLFISIIYLTYNRLEPTLVNFLRGSSLGLSTTTIFWTFYLTYGWKVSYLDRLFYRPNLNGTWYGTLNSDWTDDNGHRIEEKDFFIVIRQSFLRIHFTTFTNTFTGVSYSETFTLKKELGLKNVAYLFRKETSQNDDVFLKEGATELKLLESKNRRLEGKYWSNQKTNGTIKVEFISSDQVDSFEDAIKLLENDKSDICKDGCR